MEKRFFHTKYAFSVEKMPFFSIPSDFFCYRCGISFFVVL